jgi:2-C-methyl-D-erythritol 4-phosphate cytidylyltransferase
MQATAIIVAAGRSERFGGAVPKQFRNLCGRPMLAWTVSRFEEADSIDRIVIVVAEDQLLFTGQQVIDPHRFLKVRTITKGGATRRESVRNGLESLPISTKLVAIHDAARPLVSPSDINRVVERAAQERAAMLAVPIPDTVKRVKDGYVIGTLDRQTLYHAQTPQVFQYDLIMSAHRELADTAVTDDAELIEKRGFKVAVVEPTGPNLKVTTREDIQVAEIFLKG